jgi:CheY-like chemotaxis protein
MNGARPGVLLVDDVEANLVALRAWLENLGCDLVLAGSGNQALRQLLKREVAVMLLDVQMLEMDGYEVARFARDNPATRDVPIIFLTAINAHGGPQRGARSARQRDGPVAQQDPFVDVVSDEHHRLARGPLRCQRRAPRSRLAA